MRQLEVRTEELQDLKALEERLSGRVIRGVIEGATATVEYVPAATLSWYVNVWNCRGAIVTTDPDLDGLLATAGDRALYQELINLVVYDDHDAAINVSGRYVPRSDAALETFDRLLATVGQVDTVA